MGLAGRRLRRDIGVGGAIEIDEKVKVGPDDEASEQVSVALIRTAVLSIRIVVGDGEGVSDENDDELDDLDGSDVLFPPDLGTRRDDHHEVVPVPVPSSHKYTNKVSIVKHKGYDG